MLKTYEFQKPDQLIDRFRHEMMQADERRAKSLFVPVGATLIVTVESGGQTLTMRRENIQNKEAAMDSIHAEIEGWIYSGGRTGACEILSVELTESKDVTIGILKIPPSLVETYSDAPGDTCPVCEGERVIACDFCADDAGEQPPEAEPEMR